VVPLQTQVPPEQAAPAPQGGPLPHVHTPLAGSHPSAAVASHIAQVPPPMPHAPIAGALQTPFAQQPLGHDCELQTQFPATHTLPMPHAVLVPQRHSPEALQRLARVRSHVTHAEPLEPQLPRAAAVQVAPEQQPLGQLPALQPLQTPPVQVWAPQSWQVPPPLPHAAFVAPLVQVAPAQQPFGQLVPSQTHAPATQRCPLAHAAPVPQAQTPADKHRSAVIPQAAHAPPLLPHVASDCVRQVADAQQPFGQLVPSQTQRPETQCWPTAHIAPPPHAQLLALEQASARMGSQATHVRPPPPQLDRDGRLQVVPEQQPFGQLVPSHIQAPLEQRWPAAQAAEVPQAQVPAAEQLSARTASQPTQLTPPLPQVAKEGMLQVAPEQQPFGQLLELQPLQVPLLQVWPVGQTSQLPPPVPQDDGLSPARQVPAEQQPCGQDVPSHTHVLARHRWPGAQAVPAPHWQLPIDEQLSER
jgi:hypothetical protein